MSKFFLILVYFIFVLLALKLESFAISKNQSLMNHVIFITLITYNIYIVMAILKQSNLAKIIIKWGAYFQLLFVAIGVVMLKIGGGYKIELYGLDLTLYGSIALSLWALFKLFTLEKVFK